VGEAVRKMGVTDETHCRWCREYDRMRIGEVRRPNGIELDQLILE